MDVCFDAEFEHVANMVKRELDYLVAIYFKTDVSSSDKTVMRELQYDYESLYAVTLYRVLKFASEEFTGDSSSAKITKQLATPLADQNHWDFSNKYVDDATYSLYESEREGNRKFVDRLKKRYDARTWEQLKYLSAPRDMENIAGFRGRLLIEDSLYYSLLYKHRSIRQFLLKSEFTMGKQIDFFDELDAFYNSIREYVGYARYDLFHHFESDSKIEWFYRLLMKVKKEKRKRKLNDSAVQKLLNRLSAFHVVPLVPPECKRQYETTAPINPLHDCFGNVINVIVFDVDTFDICSEERYLKDIKRLRALNYLHNSVVVAAFPNVVERWETIFDPDSGERYPFIKALLSCAKATDFFDGYLASNNHIYPCKNPSKDITMTHFKAVYNIKKEPKRK